MIRYFLLLLACMAGTWYLVDTIKQNGPGYVLISYNNYTVETSFWFACLLLVGVVAIVYGAIRLLVFLFLNAIRLGLLPENYSRKRAARLETKGTQAFIDQHWSQAGTQLLKAAKKSDNPFLDQVMAARAYLASGNLEQADACWKIAKTLPNRDKLSLELLELDIAFAKNNIHKANALLDELLRYTGNKPPVLARAITIHSSTQNWEALSKLLPKIRKQQVLVGNSLLQLQEKIAIGLMQSGEKKRSAHQLHALWKSLSDIRQQPRVIYCYCAALVDAGEFDEAEKQIRQHLQQEWSDELIKLYGSFTAKKPDKQLAYAESLLPHHKNSAALQLTLARLALHNQLTGKAKDYVQASLQLAPTVEAYQLMADIHDRLNDTNSAKQNLRLGLTLATSQHN